MAGSVIPWDQTPGFLAATNTIIVPGGPTAYALPRQAGNSAGDVTAFHPGHVSWSKHNMPDILYILRPSDEWYAFTAAPLPPQKLSGGQFMFVGPNGNVVLSNNRNAREDHQRLLDFKILPDKIGTCEEWWFFEAVRRLDPRLRWEDILMRMEPLNRPTANAVQERTCRTWRPAFCMLSWHIIGRFAKANDRVNTVIASLSQDQLNRNTTRGSTPGLVNPHLGEAGGRVPYPAMKLGAGLSRLQARRLREEHRMNQLQGIGSDMSSEHSNEDPSGEVQEIGPSQRNPNGQAPTIANFSHENTVGESLPGIQNSDKVTKRVYSSHRPSTRCDTGSSSKQAPRVRKYVVANNNDQNDVVGAYAFNSAVHTPRRKRQYENEVQGTEQGNGFIAKRRWTGTGRSAITPVVSSSTVPQPRVIAFAGPWVPPSSFQPSITPISTASGPHPPALERFLNNFAAKPTPAAGVIAEPGRKKEVGGSYMHPVTNAMVSSNLSNRPVSSAGEDEGNVMVHENHSERFHPTQGYQWFRQDSPGSSQMKSAMNPATEDHSQASGPALCQEGPFVIPDPWMVYPAVHYDALAQQGWEDLQDAINLRFDPQMNPYYAPDM